MDKVVRGNGAPVVSSLEAGEDLAHCADAASYLGRRRSSSEVSSAPPPHSHGQPKPWSSRSRAGWTTGSAQFPLRPASSQASTGSVGSEGSTGAWARSRVSLKRSHTLGQPASQPVLEPPLLSRVPWSAGVGGGRGSQTHRSADLSPSSSHCLHTQLKPKACSIFKGGKG